MQRPWNAFSELVGAVAFICKLPAGRPRQGLHSSTMTARDAERWLLQGHDDERGSAPAARRPLLGRSDVASGGGGGGFSVPVPFLLEHRCAWTPLCCTAADVGWKLVAP